MVPDNDNMVSRDHASTDYFKTVDAALFLESVGLTYAIGL